MCIKSISKFKKDYNKTNNISKLNEKQLYVLQRNPFPKNIEYPKILSETNNFSNFLTERIIRNIYLERQTNNLNNDEKFRQITNDSMIYPMKESTNILDSCSNLPTANNSFYTNISSQENNKNTQVEEYDGLIAKCNLHSKKNRNRIVSEEYENIEQDPSPIQSRISFDGKIEFITEVDKCCKLKKYCKENNNSFDNNQIDQLQKSPRKKSCKQFFENGICTAGSNCQYTHLSKKINSSSFSYKNLISIPVNIKQIRQKARTILNRPRLAIFISLSKSKEERVSSLLLDEMLALYQEMNDKSDDYVILNYSQTIKHINDYESVNAQPQEIMKEKINQEY